jgi:hypothetical protein
MDRWSTTLLQALGVSALATLAPSAAQAQTQVWSTPTRTEQVDPKKMERAEPVAKPGPLDARVVGSWDLWVPGGVWYSTDGRTVYQNYTPGAAMNRLQVMADGSYRWGAKQGKLVEVRPWHAQPERRYYTLTAPSGAVYELYHNDTDGKLVFLFGGVGGHAATGTRLGASGAPATPAPTPPAAQPQLPASNIAPAAAYRAGEKVQVEWKGTWYAATILQVKDGQYRIHYEGWASSWDEWVAPGRIRRGAAKR